jgi:hypothetical protein
MERDITRLAISVAAALSWAVSHAARRVTWSIPNAFTPAIYEFATHRIRNDASLVWAGDIEDIVQRDDSLQIVADLANACKHLERTRTDRTGAYVTSKDVTILQGGADVVHTITLKDGTTRLATDVARDACDAWNTLFHAEGLLP